MNAPAAASNRRLRNKARDILVTLGQAPGLGLKVLGATENCILLFPRLGHPIENISDLTALTWYEVHEETLVFTPIDDIKPFLLSFA